MSGICIIGLGSPHGDDQIGWELLRQMEIESAAADSVRLRVCATLDGELLEFWRDALLAIIVDAVNGTGPPGTVRRFSLHPRDRATVPDAVRALSSHGLELPEFIELAHALGILPRRLLLFGVEVEACAPFGSLSSPLRAALPGLIQAIRAEIGAAGGQ